MINTISLVEFKIVSGSLKHVLHSLEKRINGSHDIVVEKASLPIPSTREGSGLKILLLLIQS